MKRLLFIGDSLIEYCDWQQRFPRYRVENLGIAGETVGGLLQRLPMVAAVVNAPDWVVIMTGINDVAMGNRDIAPPYRLIVRALRERFPQTRILITSLLPVLLPWVGREEIGEVNDLLRRMAEEEGVVFHDIQGSFADASGRPVSRYLLDDGVHLSARGYDVWTDELGKMLPEA